MPGCRSSPFIMVGASSSNTALKTYLQSLLLTSTNPGLAGIGIGIGKAARAARRWRYHQRTQPRHKRVAWMAKRLSPSNIAAKHVL